MESMLDGWRGHAISLASRVILIKAVLTFILVYSMSTVMLPNSVHNKIYKIGLCSRDYGGARRIHPIAWNDDCKLKHLGCLGIRTIKVMNLALVGKLGWKLLKEPNSQAQDKHPFLVKHQASPKRDCPPKSDLKWCLFWHDKWLRGRVLFTQAIRPILEDHINKTIRDFWKRENQATLRPLLSLKTCPPSSSSMALWIGSCLTFEVVLQKSIGLSGSTSSPSLPKGCGSGARSGSSPTSRMAATTRALCRASKYKKVWGEGRLTKQLGQITIRPLQWTKPKVVYVKINTNRAHRSNSNTLAPRGLIRDSNSAWQSGFVANLGSCTSIETTVHLLHREVPSTHQLSSLCHYSFSKERNVRISHPFRKSNKVADLLANLAFLSPLGTHVLKLPPDVRATSFPNLLTEQKVNR
ncbi:LOW QUALITY PROTEIN: hypothetical protein V2J09_013142 [Rumex salicifolius]